MRMDVGGNWFSRLLERKMGVEKTLGFGRPTGSGGSPLKIDSLDFFGCV